MNGKLPKFFEGEILPQSYFESPNPYADAPKSDVNLLELSRYALQHGKQLVDLTKEEVAMFRIAADS